MTERKGFISSGDKSDADILATAHISEDPKRMQINLLTPEVQTFFWEGRLHGYHPICVYWPCGKFALLFLDVDGALPPPEMIIAAYRKCEKTNSIFPEGQPSCVN